MSIFTSSKNSFEGQLPDEKTILVVRKHPVVIYSLIFIILLLMIIPIVVYFLIRSNDWYSIFSSLYWFLATLIFLILWILVFYQIMIYALTTMVITNKRVIINNQIGFFTHESVETELDKIQDISTTVTGAGATFLNLGDIEIQTASAKAKLYFNQVPNPQEIRKIILSLKEKQNN